MKIPSTLVLLGEPIEIETENLTWKFRKGTHYLACSMTGKELWVLPMPTNTREMDKIPSNGAKLFKSFVGWKPDRAFRFTQKDFISGFSDDGVSIAYRSSKWTGNPKGYIHTFENRTVIEATSEKNPSIIRIKGPRLGVRSVGIVG